jgi:hypothetical protein
VLGRSLRGRAVHPQPGRGGAPLLDPALRVGQVGEGLAAKKLSRTNCTPRSTRGLSLGERTLAGSVPNPRAWA